jgi:hypothetical protein
MIDRLERSSPLLNMRAVDTNVLVVARSALHEVDPR